MAFKATLLAKVTLIFQLPRRGRSSRRNSSISQSDADRLGFTTKSNPVGIAAREVRRISLTVLFNRFLTCALPSFRGVVRPKRLYSNPFRRANTTKSRAFRFAPFE